MSIRSLSNPVTMCQTTNDTTTSKLSFEKTWHAVVNHCVGLDWPKNTNMKRSRYLQTSVPMKTSLMIFCKTPFIAEAEA